MSENTYRSEGDGRADNISYDVSYDVSVPTSASTPEPPAPSEDTQTSSQIVESYVERLLGGEAAYTVAEASAMCGLLPDEILYFWRALGFPIIEDVENERLFTPADVQAMSEHAAMIRNEDKSISLNDESMQMLLRAQSQSMDRLVFWQQEALMEYAETVLGLEASAARAWLLEHIGNYENFLSVQMSYAWRRHFAALLRRTELESDSSRADLSKNYLSRRALGFIDMVSFTRRSEELGNIELLALIETFDHACRDVITSKGGRVVKNIGDSFLYTADSIEIAVDITTTIVDKLREIEGMLPVHASVVWGEVISRFGDVFGATVNLASRLADAAMPNTILTDEKTAAIIHKIGLKYTTVDLGHHDLQGLGPTRLMELRRILTT